MLIGLFTSGYQRNPLEHAFEDAKRFGYDYIELWGGRPSSYAPDLKAGEIDNVLRLIDKYEMPIVGYSPEANNYPYNYMIGSESQRQEAVSYLKLCFDMAKRMGAEWTLVSTGHAGYYATHEEIWARLEKTLKELTEYAQSIGHTVLMETTTPWETNVIKNSNDLGELFKRVPSRNLVGMLDIVAPFVQDESIFAYFDKLGDKMRHLHIVDSNGTDETHVMPGEGIMPMKQILQELVHMDYKGTATIELVTAYIREPRMYAKRAIDNVRDMLK
ncbi:MAG: fructoselysine 3-epimerase [Clostridia bacterium]|nr:fructoselysine 3-epimerase [Clostridia bacterium]